MSSIPNVRPVSDWQRVWWFPFLWRRRIGWFLSTAPNVPVDINSFWWECRFGPENPIHKQH